MLDLPRIVEAEPVCELHLIQRVAQEDISVAMITLVGCDDGVECFGKSNFLHGKGAAQEGSERYDNQQPRREQIVYGF